MATSPPTKDERDANLDALQTSLDEWADSEKTRLENEVKFMRSVLKGRTGSETAGTLNLASAGDVIVAEIENFLSFGAG